MVAGRNLFENILDDNAILCSSVAVCGGNMSKQTEILVTQHNRIVCARMHTFGCSDNKPWVELNVIVACDGDDFKLGVTWRLLAVKHNHHNKSKA